MRKIWRVGLMLAGGMAAAACGTAGKSSEPAASAKGDVRPNIVFILADDMGYGDVRALNPASKIPTPNLDRLAASGMTFTDAHTPSSVCTPTRYGVITGRYCWRSRLKRGVLWGYSGRLIEEGRQTVASMLQSSGYHTAVIGKWHLGLNWAKKGPKADDVDFTKPVTGGPIEMGFDRSFLVPASLDMPPYVFVANGRVVTQPTLTQPAVKFPAFIRKGPRATDFVVEQALDRLTDEASDYIAARAGTGKPFFLYMPLTAPHKPALPHKRFRGTTAIKDYGDFVAQVDDTVGRVLKALDDAGVSDDTLVVCTSDNGSYMYRLDDPNAKDHVDDTSIQAYRADRHRANHIYRGTKADVWEAGHRVPFLARWPGRIQPGSRTDETVCLTDFMATCAEIVGAKLGADEAEDSHSLLPLMTGRSQAWNRPPVIHHSAAGMFAIREGKWKLVAGNGSGGRQQPKGKPFGKPYRLFDLQADPSETKNLIETHPKVAAELEAALQKIRSEGRSVRR